MAGGIIDSLLEVADDILSVREDIGAAIHLLYVVTRTWSGDTVHSGSYTDTEAKVSPTPGFRDLSHDIRATEGGTFQRGDIMIKGISKASYPDKAVVSLECPEENVERFYRIDGKLYRVIHVKESYVTWDVHVRALNSGYS